jgi:hypothetical protein
MRSAWATGTPLSFVARPSDQGLLLRPKTTASSAQTTLSQAGEIGESWRMEESVGDALSACAAMVG